MRRFDSHREALAYAEEEGTEVVKSRSSDGVSYYVESNEEKHERQREQIALAKEAHREREREWRRWQFERGREENPMYGKKRTQHCAGTPTPLGTSTDNHSLFINSRQFGSPIGNGCYRTMPRNPY